MATKTQLDLLRIAGLYTLVMDDNKAWPDESRLIHVRSDGEELTIVDKFGKRRSSAGRLPIEQVEAEIVDIRRIQQPDGTQMTLSAVK